LGKTSVDFAIGCHASAVSESPRILVRERGL